ncbi:hypothetical protein ABH940_006694 [Streptacidiphilus sp. BW17]|uniref:hypothetical protein n=1 Tax=Streptacidiphilus sp. BW17 TaxID=3156274 RepID=UPI003517FB3A
MDPTITGALIGAGGSLAIFIGGIATNSISNRGAAKSAAQQQARSAVQELIQAALDLQLALVAWETRWRDRSVVTGTIARAVTQVIAGNQEGHLFHGMATGLGTAAEWRGAADGAQETIVLGPMSRMTAATAHISMLQDAPLREASNGVVMALAELMTAYGSKPKSPERRNAERRVGEALGKVGDAARAYDGRARR